VVHGGDG
jgi:hypothetical protein